MARAPDLPAPGGPGRLPSIRACPAADKWKLIGTPFRVPRGSVVDDSCEGLRSGFLCLSQIKSLEVLGQ